VVLPALGDGVCRGDVVRLCLVPPLVLLHRCQCCMGGAAFSGEACLGFVRCLGVLVFLLPLALLASACQCLGVGLGCAPTGRKRGRRAGFRA
jgi:hypothetical protein